MSAFRPMFSAVRPATMPLRSALPRQAIRGFAEQAPRETPKPAAAAADAAKSSNLPLILSLAGVGGLAAFYSFGGFADAKQQVKAVGGLAPGALDRKEFKEFTLKEVHPYNHDSSTFVFELPDGLVSGMQVASAVLIKGAGEGVKDKDGKEVIRPYTPVTSPDTPGHIDFLIKRYENGAMTKHIHSLKPGDAVAIKGPIDKFQYKPNTYEQIGMIAGGSGITPMWQVIQCIASNPSDKTNVTLLYTNKTEKDILLREKFDELAAKDSRFKVIYGLDKKPRSMGGDSFEGYVTPEHISKFMPSPGKADKIKLFVCGPPGQVEVVCGMKGPKGSQGELKGLLADAGYQPDQIYKF